MRQFCHEICRKLIFETEVKNSHTLEDYLLAFDNFVEDKKYLENIYIQFKQNVLKAMMGQEELYEPLTAVEIIELAEKLKWKAEKKCEFDQVLFFFLIIIIIIICYFF